MSNRGLVNDVAIVGVGGAGTNIAFCLEKLGYTTIHINSSKCWYIDRSTHEY